MRSRRDRACRGERTAGDRLSELAAGTVQPDPVFRAVLRDHLVASAARPEETPPAPPPRPRPRRPVLTGAATVTAILFAAHLAVFHPKLGHHWPMEQTGAGSGLEDSAKDRRRGDRELGEAKREAGRLVALAARPGVRRTDLAGAARAMDEHTQAASAAFTRVYERTGDRAPLTELAAFGRDQHRRLKPMLARLPADVRPPAAQSLKLICGISKKVTGLLGTVPAGPRR